MSGGDAAARLTPSRAVLAFAACGFAGLYLLFAVVPVLASRSGGRIGAGLATGVFMGATVLFQAAMPYIMARVRPHILLGISLLLLAGSMPTPSGGVGQQRGEPLRPLVDRNVIDLDAAFGQ
jgi:hypothetical protein